MDTSSGSYGRAWGISNNRDVMGKHNDRSAVVFWRSQTQSETLALVLQSMEQSGYMLSKKGDFVLDDTFGKLNSVVGNIILICANEHAVKSNMAQWLLINDKTTHMLIVHPV